MTLYDMKRALPWAARLSDENQEALLRDLEAWQAVADAATISEHEIVRGRPNSLEWAWVGPGGTRE